jgi:dihydropteroate synthase
MWPRSGPMPAWPTWPPHRGRVVLMHMQGMPKTMQQDPVYDDLLGEVGDFLAWQAQTCMDAGVEAERIVVDPGIGFGKTFAHNLTLDQTA